MKTIRRLGFALMLTLAFTLPVFAGEMNAPPGQTDTPPGEMQTPPAAGDAGIAQTPSSVADAIWLVITSALQDRLDFFLIDAGDSAGTWVSVSPAQLHQKQILRPDVLKDL